jgi:hypothetical protein
MHHAERLIDVAASVYQTVYDFKILLLYFKRGLKT